VQLIDGELVMTDAEEWRAECLARWVLKLETIDHRRKWITKFEASHGAEAANKLRDDMLRVHANDKRR
jgi:hypothetical protein